MGSSERGQASAVGPDGGRHASTQPRDLDTPLRWRSDAAGLDPLYGGGSRDLSGRPSTTGRRGRGLSITPISLSLPIVASPAPDSPPAEPIRFDPTGRCGAVDAMEGSLHARSLPSRDDTPIGYDTAAHLDAGRNAGEAGHGTAASAEPPHPAIATPPPAARAESPPIPLSRRSVREQRAALRTAQSPELPTTPVVRSAPEPAAAVTARHTSGPPEDVGTTPSIQTPQDAELPDPAVPVRSRRRSATTSPTEGPATDATSDGATVRTSDGATDPATDLRHGQQGALQAVLEAFGVGVVVSDPTGTAIAANSRAQDLLARGEDAVAVTRSTVPGPDGTPRLVIDTVMPAPAPRPAPGPMPPFVTPPPVTSLLAAASPAPAAPAGTPGHVPAPSARGRRLPGSPMPGELTVMPETPCWLPPDPLTDPDYLLRDRERAAALAERRFAAAMEHSPTGFAVLTPAGEVLDANKALARMLSRPVFELIGSRLEDFAHPDDPEADAELLDGLLAGRRDSYTLERRYVRPRGETIWARTSMTAVHDADGAVQQLITQIHDITEIRLAEEALSHQALHDPLTGLPNRTLMLDRIQQALDRTRRSHRRVAVLCCALDRFNVVSDGVGHEHGDAVLIEVSRRLERVLRSTDTAARLNGDEFAIVCEDVADEREAVLVADRILAAVRTPIDVGGRAIVQTISIGIAVSSPRAADAVSLLRDAGTALHRAQENGQDRWGVADDELRRRAVDRLDIEHALRAALNERHLRVYFQPIVDLTTRRPVGHEALVRWQHPTRGLLAPAWFLPIAEETGLIEDIGRWVLLEAARATAARPGNGYVAVNVSASQVMRAGLVADVEAVLEETGLPPSRLVVELTESVMLGAAPAGRRELHKLDDLGVRMVVDDFGTGFSALSYLRDLPVSGIKVDRSFTAGLGQDAQCERIVEALTGLAGGLGVDLVAEGVETERQRSLLTRIGCVHAQGYLFGRPAPHDEHPDDEHPDDADRGEPAAADDSADGTAGTIDLDDAGRRDDDNPPEDADARQL